MPEVPFTRIGEGQSARLVYQVMGNNGPVANPAGIRFMAAGSATDASSAVGGPVPGLFTMSGAIGLLDLGFGVANLGVSAAVLQNVRRIERRLDQVWLQLDYQARRIDEVAQRLERVDVNVAEQNLRASMRHVLARCTGHQDIDLNALDALADDMVKFTDSLSGWGFGLAPNLKLSTDLRAMLSSVWRLLYGAQLSMIAAHNVRQNGDPERVRLHPFEYLKVWALSSLPSSAVERLIIMRGLNGVGDELGSMIYENFFFAGQDQRNSYKEWFEERVEGTIVSVFEATPLALVLTQYIDPVLPEIETDEDFREAVDWVSDYLGAWMMSDAGLLYRTEQALLANRDEEFWSGLEIDGDEGVCIDLDVEASTHAIAG